MLKEKEAAYIIEQLFGSDAIIKTMSQNTDSIFVDVLDSTIRKPGEYFINKVRTDGDYIGLMIESLSFAVIKQHQ